MEEQLVLEELINAYYDDKEKADYFKKIAEDYNKNIKKLFKELNIEDYSTSSGLTAKVSITTKDIFNEPALIEKLKELGADAAIELVPTINWDTIEDMIYNGKLSAAELVPFKEEKEVVTLRVTQKKG